MKKGLIFATTLAMALGVGVAVGAHQAKAPVKADAVSAGTDIYLDVSGGNWFSDNAKVAIWNHQGSVFEEFVEDAESGLYKVSLSAACTSFNLFRGEALNWNNKWNQSDDASFEEGKNKIISSGYSDGKMTFTWGTYTPKQKPSAEKSSYYVYDKSGVLGAFAGVNVYGFDPNEVYEEMVWPGEHTSVSQVTLGNTSMYQVQVSVSYSSFIMNGNSKQTVDVDATGKVGKVLFIENNTDESGHYTVEWRDTSYYTDYPASEGYYLVGSATEWSFSGAPKLTADPVDSEHNHGRLIRYSATKGEKFKVFGYFNGERSYFGYHIDEEHDQEDYIVAATGLLNVWCSKDGHIYVAEGVPAADGYYLQGSAIGWDYEHALVMTPTSQDGNLAYYMGLTVAVNDEIRARRYLTSEVTFEQWAVFGNTKIHEETIGEMSGDNLKFTKAGTYDLYFKEENSQLKLYIAEHVDTYSISMTAVKFEGATKEATVAQEAQLAYSNVDFEPVQPVIEGYASQGYFTDEDCTVAYVPHKYEAAGQLYARYMKVGYYVISGAGNWKIENAVPMMTAGIAETNKAEAAVTVANKNETYSFVYFNEAGIMEGHDGLDKEYAYAVYVSEGSHIKFTETGTYAVYWAKGDNKIYLNDGSTAYCTTFLSATRGVCELVNKSEEYISSLQTVWTAQKNAYQALNDGAKAEIVKVGFDGGKEDGTVAEQLMARYHYIVCKYGSEKFENFIFPGAEAIAPSVRYYNEFDAAGDNTTMIIIIAVAATSALAFGALLLIKKRKHN